jgi:hypothetical protein
MCRLIHLYRPRINLFLRSVLQFYSQKFVKNGCAWLSQCIYNSSSKYFTTASNYNVPYHTSYPSIIIVHEGKFYMAIKMTWLACVI